MSLSLYLDEDFASTAHARALMGGGVDVLRPHDVEMLARTDEEQLAFAADARRSLVSYNRRDFQRLHSAWMRSQRYHAGIILVEKRDNYSPGEVLRRVQILIESLGGTEPTNQLLFLGNYG